MTAPTARPAAPPDLPPSLEELCQGCDEPLPDDDPGVEAYVMYDDGGERLFLYCAKCARERGL